MADIESEIIKRSANYRGVVLHRCILIEKQIDYFITNYFTTDYRKRQELLELLLDRANFDGKISILEVILKNSYLGDFKRRFAKLFSELRYCKDQRNMFAHYMVYSWDRAINEFPEKISLLNFRNSLTYESYDEEKYNDLLMRLEKCTDVLYELIREVFPNRSDPME